MKIVILVPSFFPEIGGLERVAEQWAEAIVSKGHEIILLTETFYTGIHIFPFQVVRRASRIMRFRILLNCDVICSMDLSLKQVPEILFSRKPWIVSHHTALLDNSTHKPWQQRLKHWFANRVVDCNVCCSHFIASSFKMPEVIWSPYNNKIFRCQNLPRKINSLLFVGRLVSVKGVRDLLLAFFAFANR